MPKNLGFDAQYEILSKIMGGEASLPMEYDVQS